MKAFNSTILEQIGATCLKQKYTVSVAESVTGGYLQAALCSITDAGNFFQGGITVYNLGQKCKHLHVEPIHAIACNCVSEQTAQEMAIGCCKLFTSNYALAITGYAGGLPANVLSPFAIFSIAQKDKILVTRTIKVDIEDNEDIQITYVNTVLEAFIELLTLQQ